MYPEIHLGPLTLQTFGIMFALAFLGAGAVGLLYGTRLAVAGHPVRWLVRTDADILRRDGIEVRSEGQVLRVEPADVVASDDPTGLPPSDVVLLATKTTANDRLTELVGSVLTGDTILGRGTTILAQPEGALQDYLASLKRLRDLPQAQLVLPAHGPMLPSLSTIASRYHGHRHLRLIEIDRALEAPLRDALVAADFTYDLVAEAIGDDAHRALGRNETLPALRRTTSGSPLDTLVRLFLLQTPVARDAADRAG